MDRPDDLDRKNAEILAMLKHGDGDDYWRAVHAVGSLVAELVELRGFRAASLAYLRGPIGGVIEEACVVAADDIERGYSFARDKGAALERAAVVAWLRESRRIGPDDPFGQAWIHACMLLARDIERGDHRRKEGT